MPSAMEDGQRPDLEYELDPNNQLVLVRSVEATVRAYLRFTNCTCLPVNVWWRDYHGKRRFYVRLESGTHYDVNSFLTHPWQFTEAFTNQRCVIDNNYIFRAPVNAGGTQHRTNWNITIKVQPLRTIALIAVGQRVKCPKSVRNLGLPRVLNEELKRLLVVMQRPLTPLLD